MNHDGRSVYLGVVFAFVRIFDRIPRPERVWEYGCFDPQLPAHNHTPQVATPLLFFIMPSDVLSTPLSFVVFLSSVVSALS